MIEGLRPYPEMADTGVAWLPSAPRGWATLRAKYVFQEVDHRSLDGQETHLSMHQKLGLVPSADTGEKRLVSESYAGGKLVEPNDLVLNRLKAHLGVFAYATRPGVISPDYTVLRPLPNAYVRYYEYLLKSPACRGELRTRTKGIVEGFWRLYTDDFYDIRLPVPPLDEQRLIVRFLDWHGAMTGKVIRAKRRLIALLNEQKQSIIHRAVTRGLDPTAPLKPSGVEWLGDVPAQWEVKPLKQTVAGIVGGSTPKSGEPEYWDGDVIWVTPSDISQSERLNTSLRKITASGLASCGATLVPAGSVIITSRAPVGNVAVADVELATNQGCKALIFDPQQVEVAFAFNLLRVLKPELVSLATGTTFAEISTGRLGAVKVPVPPLGEQADILEALDRGTSEFNSALKAAEAEIALIQEFRTRLIADVVTGQLDVRGAAASLPDVAEGEAFADAPDDIDDEDEDALDVETEDA